MEITSARAESSFRASATACATASPAGGGGAGAAELSPPPGLGAVTDAPTLTCAADAVGIPTEIVICSGMTIVALSEGMLSPVMLELFEVAGVFEAVDTVMAA